MARAGCTTSRTKARALDPLPSILIHTFLDLNLRAASCRRVARWTVLSSTSECSSAFDLIALLRG